MADTTSPVPDAAAPAAEQTPVAEPVAAPAGGDAADEAKPTTDAPKEEAEKTAGKLNWHRARKCELYLACLRWK